MLWRPGGCACFSAAFTIFDHLVTPAPDFDVCCHPWQPNEISYNSAIHACGRGGQWELALSLLKEMRELGLSPDRISFGAMVSVEHLS